jgi:hypothetical protein
LLVSTFLSRILEQFKLPMRICPPIRLLLILNLINIPFYFLFAFVWVSEVVQLILLCTGAIILFGYIFINRAYYQLWKAAHGHSASWLLLQVVMLLACHGVVFLIASLPGVSIV